MCIEPLDRIEVPWTSNFENNLIFCIFHHILSTRLSCNMAGSPESFLASVEKGLDEDANTGEPGEREEADREAALDLVSILAHTHTNSHGLTAVYAKNPTVQRGRKREMWMLVDESIFQTEDATKEPEPATAEPSNVVVDGKTVGKKRKRKASRKRTNGSGKSRGKVLVVRATR